MGLSTLACKEVENECDCTWEAWVSSVSLSWTTERGGENDPMSGRNPLGKSTLVSKD